MPLRVWVADKQGVKGAVVEGYVRRPDGVKINVLLSDNGLSMDGGANDGIYGLAFTATIPGAYFVHLKASGTSTAGEPFERYMMTAFVLPGQPKRPGEGFPVPPGGRCNCEAETKYSIAVYAGSTFPHGSFNTIANPGFSFGVRPAFHFGGRASLGLYVGRDNFANAGTGSGFHLTHFSPEFEFALSRRLCPVPTVHIGAGAYRNELGDTKFGFNVGTGLSVCLNRRISFVPRYDYRSVNGFSRNYSTFQFGLRFNF